LRVSRDDRLRMAGAKPVDVLDRSIDVIDNLDRNFVIKILRMPVHDRLATEAAAGFFTAENLDSASFEGFRERQQKGISTRTIDQDCFNSIADCHILGFAIDSQLDGHLLLRIISQVEMADPICMAEHGNACMLHDVADKFVRATRNQ